MTQYIQGILDLNRLKSSEILIHGTKNSLILVDLMADNGKLYGYRNSFLKETKKLASKVL